MGGPHKRISVVSWRESFPLGGGNPHVVLTMSSFQRERKGLESIEGSKGGERSIVVCNCFLVSLWAGSFLCS